ncbi:MAG: DUF3892 domain-containing protein [bacterium]
MADHIHGNADGENGENDTYSIPGRGSTISRRTLVREVKQGKHPNYHIYERKDEEYLRADPDHRKSNNVDGE